MAIHASAVRVGAGARLMAVGIKAVKNINKFKGASNVDDLYDLATFSATAATCGFIDRYTAGGGLIALGTSTLLNTKYYNKDTGHLDQRIVDAVLWGGLLADFAKEAGYDELTIAKWLRDPNLAGAAVAAAIIAALNSGLETPLYSYVAGCAAAVAVEDALKAGTDIVRNLLYSAGITWEPETWEYFRDQILPYRLNDRYGLPVITPKTKVNIRQGMKISPLVLDLDGDGVETTSVNDQWVMFDLDGDGVKNRTGWAGADDGIFAH